MALDHRLVVQPPRRGEDGDVPGRGAARRSAALVAKGLGKTGINLIGRIVGLILAANAVQFVLDGILAAFPKLT